MNASKSNRSLHQSPSLNERRPDSRRRTSSPLSVRAFGDSGLASRLAQASEDDLHDADFGIMKTDADGTLLFYNQFEEQFSGISASKAVGSNFFDEVAPCTRSRLFQGRFEKGVRDGALDEQFTYMLTYRLRPTLVDIRLLGGRKQTVWILVRPKMST